MATAKSNQFLLRGIPFLCMMAFGSWGLSQFLKLPTQIKDDRKKRKIKGKEEFDLSKELEVRSTFCTWSLHIACRLCATARSTWAQRLGACRAFQHAIMHGNARFSFRRLYLRWLSGVVGCVITHTCARGAASYSLPA
eukprot:6193271-Pleurochrysis_carterae.AAC.3